MTHILKMMEGVQVVNFRWVQKSIPKLVYSNGLRTVIRKKEGSSHEESCMAFGDVVFDKPGKYYFEVMYNGRLRSIFGIGERGKTSEKSYLGKTSRGWGCQFFNPGYVRHFGVSKSDSFSHYKKFNGLFMAKCGVLLTLNRDLRGSLHFFVDGNLVEKSFSNVTAPVSPCFDFYQFGNSATIIPKPKRDFLRNATFINSGKSIDVKLREISSVKKTLANCSVFVESFRDTVLAVLKNDELPLSKVQSMSKGLTVPENLMKTIKTWVYFTEYMQKKKLFDVYTNYITFTKSYEKHFHGKFTNLLEFFESAKTLHGLAKNLEREKPKLLILEKMFVRKFDLRGKPPIDVETFGKVLVDMENVLESYKVIRKYTHDLRVGIEEFESNEAENLLFKCVLRNEEITKLNEIINSCKMPRQMLPFQEELEKMEVQFDRVSITSLLKKCSQSEVVITLVEQTPGKALLVGREGALQLSCIFRSKSNLQKVFFKIGKEMITNGEISDINISKDIPISSSHNRSNPLFEFLQIVGLDSYYPRFVAEGITKMLELNYCSDEHLKKVFENKIIKIDFFRKSFLKYSEIGDEIEELCVKINLDNENIKQQQITFEDVDLEISNQELIGMILKKIGLENENDRNFKLKFQGNKYVKRFGETTIREVLLKQVLLSNTRKDLETVKCIFQ